VRRSSASPSTDLMRRRAGANSSLVRALLEDGAHRPRSFKAGSGAAGCRYAAACGTSRIETVRAVSARRVRSMATPSTGCSDRSPAQGWPSLGDFDSFTTPITFDKLALLKVNLKRQRTRCAFPVRVESRTDVMDC
jgi:hypothetical protein